jgi:membrane-associated phospholipid phosphatase
MMAEEISARRRIEDLDRALLVALRSHMHQRWLQAVMVRLAASAEDGAIWMALGAGMGVLDPPRRRRWVAAGALGPAAIVANYPLKRLFNRRRPRLDLTRLSAAPSEHSFPSSHAASSFAAASAMADIEPRLRALPFALAALIGVGRPYLGMHYPTDVLAGAIFGLIAGRAARPFLRHLEGEILTFR